MLIEYLTLDQETGKVYTVHFGGEEPPTQHELVGTLWCVGELAEFVESADIGTDDSGRDVIHFTLMPTVDRVIALRMVVASLEPQLRYTLNSLRVKVVIQQCGQHYGARIDHVFYKGLAPEDTDRFVTLLVKHILMPETLQCRHDPATLAAIVDKILQMQSVHLQGTLQFQFLDETVFPCGLCMAKTSHQN